MSWVPVDLRSMCSANDQFTTCAPGYAMFVALVVRLFGSSIDSKSYDPYQQSETINSRYKQYQRQSYTEEYDFIIVGGGSAGCVLANRLSEIITWKVLLLEAGIEEPEAAKVPSFSKLLYKSNIDWGSSTVPQIHSCLSKPNKQCYWGGGKVMGGSSSTNNMMYVRGNPRDYDDWERMGNDGWGYKSVLPYFKKSERNTDSDVLVYNPQHHSKNGYLYVGRFDYLDANALALMDAWKALGLQEVDVNAGDTQLGVMKLQMTQREGMRVSANTAFVAPIRYKRKNLTVRTQAHVSKILIDSHGTAYGIEYLQNNIPQRVYARKEVIISAGATNSPKLLMLSGIGPRDYLSSLGIETISNLSVGHNLQDHVTFEGLILALQSNLSATTVPINQIIGDTYEYYKTRKGPLTAVGTLSISAFVQTSQEPQLGIPDIQYATEGVNIRDFLTDPARAAEYNLGPLAYYDGIHIKPILLAPRSKGFIGLNKSDPILGPPEIQPNYFSSPPDLNILVESVLKVIKLQDTFPMKRIKAKLVEVPLPACREHAFGSTAYWSCVIVQYTNSVHHAVGTCKMGPSTDPEAVVNPELRVYGVKNLRVIDSSIMPKIVRGNTNAPTIMIAEKGADMIKRYWGV